MTAKQTTAKKPAAKKATTKTPAKRSAAQTEALVMRAPKPVNAIASQVAQTPAAAPAKPKTVRKASDPAKPKAKTSKTSAAVVAFVARKMEPGQMLHVLDEPSRPTSGTRLYAHTHAALHVLGLLDAARPSIPKKAILTVMGQTAVSYHMRQRNFEAAPDGGVRLSLIGYNKFKDRAIDGALANGFTDMFLSGKIDPALLVRPNNVYQAAVGV